MSLKNFYCFPGDISEFTGSGGNVTADNLVTRKSAYSLKIVSNGASNNYATLSQPLEDWLDYDYGLLQPQEFHVTGWLYIDTMPTTGDVLFYLLDGTAKMLAEIRFGSPGHLSIYRWNPSIPGPSFVAGTSSNMSTGSWNYFDVHLQYVSGSSWSYGIKINGVLECSGSAVFGNEVVFAAFIGNYVRRSSNAWTVHIEALALWEAGEPTATKLYSIYAPAAGDGNYTAWTGDYTDVNEITTHDGDTTKIVRSTAGVTAAETVAHAGAAALGISTRQIIRGVKPILWVKKNSGTSVGLRYRFKTDAQNWDTINNEDPGTSYVIRQTIYEINPESSTVWSDPSLGSDEFTAFNAVQEGLVLRAVSGSGIAHCTKIGLGVLVEEPKIKSPYVPHAGI